MSSDPQRRRTAVVAHVLLLAAACLPLLSMLWGGVGFLAHPDSELPVRLWTLDIMPEIGLLGGMVDVIGHPTPGALNNPDPVGTIVVTLLRPLLGLAGAWNALIVGLLFANMAATRALVMAWLSDEVAAFTAALGVGLMPLALSYGVASAIVDMLNLWPYPLGLLAMLRISRGADPVRMGALAGLCVGLGALSSPYALVVAVGGLPVGALLMAPRWLSELRRPMQRRRWLKGLAAAAVVGVALCGIYFWQLLSIMNAPGSQMSAEYVAYTRNAPPWDTLRPGHPSQFPATLSEYVAWGGSGLKERDTGSHYMRTAAVPMTVLLWALVGVVVGRRSGAWAWAGVAVVALLASTGPFLCVSDTAAFSDAVNPFFFYVHYATPGGAMLLESFRYGFLAAFAFAMTAAVGVAWLRGQGRVERWLALLVPVGLLAELALLSPVPIPLPVAQPQVGEAYHRLDEVLPPGPIIELPFTDGDSGRFSRIHFLNQRFHGRTIADQVRGWPPDLFLDNDLLRALVAAEALDDMILVNGSYQRPPHDPRAPVQRYRRLLVYEREGQDLPGARRALVDVGFVGIVIDPQGYTSQQSLDRVNEVLGQGTVTLGDRLVHPLVGSPRR